MIISLILYGVLGAVLSACGINVIDHTLQYFCIMLLVVAIDINSYARA